LFLEQTTKDYEEAEEQFLGKSDFNSRYCIALGVSDVVKR
jgi:hypothetical protein